MILPALTIATTLEVTLATSLVHIELPEAEYPGEVGLVDRFKSSIVQPSSLESNSRAKQAPWSQNAQQQKKDM